MCLFKAALENLPITYFVFFFVFRADLPAPSLSFLSLSAPVLKFGLDLQDEAPSVNYRKSASTMKVYIVLVGTSSRPFLLFCSPFNLWRTFTTIPRSERLYFLSHTGNSGG